jgi:hypothetical protein
LSKLRNLLLIVSFCALLFQACSSQPKNNNTAPPASNGQTKNEFPFSTKEPEVYQGDFYAGTSEYQNRWFVARKGDNWRIDYFKDNKKDWSQLKTDKLYYLDHKKKIYAAEPMSGDKNSVQSSYFTTLLSGFFKGKEYRHFDDMGREGDLKKYKVRDEQSQDQIILYVDEKTGIVVKQELMAHNEQEGNASTATFTYEIKNFKSDVDPDAFEIPADYKFVDWSQYSPNAPSNK